MADRYKIYEKLGAGGVGAVFRAYDSQLKRWVAVKRLLTANEAAQDSEIESELRREADTLASLRNPNVVTIFDVGSDAEGLFMVMELLQGEDLADVVARGPLPYDDFKELAQQTLEGLLSAHQHHVLHRDIKPENIKVERLPGGRMQSKIIDFGLARAGLRARKQTEDQDGTVMGSIFYMAPEQLTREPVDERTDLYSLGCVFYEALSGKKAFDGDSMSDVIDKHINHDLIPLHVVAPHVPPWLGAWCMRLMAQKPDERPVNAQQAIEEFRAWERMPTMVPYMPWMGMYPGNPSASQPMYMPGTGAVPVPGTGAVPVAPAPEYIPVAEAVAEPMQAAQVVYQVEPVLSQSYTEMAAITTPLAPPPARPGSSSRSVGTAHRLPAGAGAEKRPAAGGKTADKTKLYIILGAGALVVAVLAYFIFGGSGKPGSRSSGSGVLAAVTSTEPPKVTFQLPTDRIYPPADRNISVFLVGSAGTLSDRKGADGKLARASTNQMVMEWHDLGERGNDNILRAFEGKAAHAPKLVDWPSPGTGLGVKPGRKVLDFRARDGKPVCLEMDDAKSQVQQLPFGTAGVLGDPGASVAAMFQVEDSRLPMRIVGLSDGKEASIALRVDSGKNVIAELKNGKASGKIVSKSVNGALPVMVVVTWNKNGDAEMRVRDYDGKAFSGKAKVAAPGAPLHELSIGRVNDPAADQFQGYLAELIVYASALKLDQAQLLEGRTREFYLEKAPPPPPAPKK
jgi:hypothetical protein